jgi:hypothetical protein
MSNVQQGMSNYEGGATLRADKTWKFCVPCWKLDIQGQVRIADDYSISPVEAVSPPCSVFGLTPTLISSFSMR